MTRTELGKIEEIVMMVLYGGSFEVIPDDKTMDDLGADSLDLIDIGLSIDEAFRVNLEIKSNYTKHDILKEIRKLRDEQNRVTDSTF